MPVADVRSLTHYGEPYDGNTRFFRSTLFVAAVRSCYDEACLLHGVDWMPPKVCSQLSLPLGCMNYFIIWKYVRMHLGADVTSYLYISLLNMFMLISCSETRNVQMYLFEYAMHHFSYMHQYCVNLYIYCLEARRKRKLSKQRKEER